MIDGYPQKIIEMIGIKIHQLSIQTSVIGRHLGLPLQGDLDGYSKVCDILGGKGGGQINGILFIISFQYIYKQMLSESIRICDYFFFFFWGGVLDNWY